MSDPQNNQSQLDKQLSLNKSLLSTLNQESTLNIPPQIQNMNNFNYESNFIPQQNTPQLQMVNTQDTPQIIHSIQPALPLFQMTPNGQLIPVPTYFVTKQFPVIQRKEETGNRTNLSYNSAFTNNFNIGDGKIYFNKQPATSMSFCHTSNETCNEFPFVKKTKKNKIIIDNEKQLPYLEEVNPMDIKHHSAPVRILSVERERMAQNYLRFNPYFNNYMNIPNFNQRPLGEMSNFEEEGEEINIGEQKVFPCEHNGCELIYKTRKQLIAHHYKKNIECQKDSIQILNLIAKAKEKINQLIADKKISEDNEELKKLEQKYQEKINKFSNNDYSLLICGTKLREDKSQQKDI
ncbi:MAG: hypothetical protein MJ252_06915 [archaeon]|nr:hypothetical protein [archaeon]